MEIQTLSNGTVADDALKVWGLTIFYKYHLTKIKLRHVTVTVEKGRDHVNLPIRPEQDVIVFC